MKLMKVVLWIDAALAAVGGLLLGLIPGHLGLAIFDTSPHDHTWLRVAGLEGLVLAILMVLLSIKVEELRNWAWSVVLLTGGLGLFSLLKFILKLGETYRSKAWLIGGAVSLVLAVLLAWGIWQTGRSKPSDASAEKPSA